jgi:hypothetical protein
MAMAQCITLTLKSQTIKSLIDQIVGFRTRQEIIVFIRETEISWSYLSCVQLLLTPTKIKTILSKTPNSTISKQNITLLSNLSVTVNNIKFSKIV